MSRQLWWGDFFKLIQSKKIMTKKSCLVKNPLSRWKLLQYHHLQYKQYITEKQYYLSAVSLAKCRKKSACMSTYLFKSEQIHDWWLRNIIAILICENVFVLQFFCNTEYNKAKSDQSLTAWIWICLTTFPLYLTTTNALRKV